jgi:hypothetical protein
MLAVRDGWTTLAFRRDPSTAARWGSIPIVDAARLHWVKIDARQPAMRAKLACAVPQLIDELERTAPGWGDIQIPLWGTNAIDALGALNLNRRAQIPVRFNTKSGRTEENQKILDLPTFRSPTKTSRKHLEFGRKRH